MFEYQKLIELNTPNHPNGPVSSSRVVVLLLLLATTRWFELSVAYVTIAFLCKDCLGVIHNNSVLYYDEVELLRNQESILI
jgi:hypothetical protein